MPSIPFRHSLKTVFGALLLMGLVACGETPVSDIKAAAAIEAIRGSDAKAWEAVRSKKVRWAGRVDKVMMVHGDEFVKEYFLRFDPGFGPKSMAMAEIQINPSQAENYKPGQAITVTGLVLSHEKEGQMTIVKLGSGKVE